MSRLQINFFCMYYKMVAIAVEHYSKNGVHTITVKNEKQKKMGKGKIKRKL